MAGGKRKEPHSFSVDQGSSKKPDVSKPVKPLRKQGSKTGANGVGVRNADNDFFNDEEAWIKIYYTLLVRKAAQQVDMPILPTTDILLSFNAYFQGFKEPIGKPSLSSNGRAWFLECVALPTRIRRDRVEFEGAVHCVCPELKTQIDELREQRPEYVDAEADASSLFVTPEQITRVLEEAGKLDAEGNPVRTALDNLSPPDHIPADTDPWGDKAVAQIDARNAITSEECGQWPDYTKHHWNPQDIPAASLRPGPQMVNRHEDATYANAIINACPVPPLGFFRDLRELKKQDFTRDHYDEKERKVEQAKHKEQVRIMRLSRKVNQARRLLADCKDKYGPLDELFSMKDIVRYLDTHTVEAVEAWYEEVALATKSQEEHILQTAVIIRSLAVRRYDLNTQR